MAGKRITVAQSSLQDGAFLRVVVAGSLVRLVLFTSPHLCDALANRPEITTPVTSFKRLREGLYLLEHGLDPYEGDIYQQSPLLLILFSVLPADNKAAIAALYTAVDVAIAWLLWHIAAARRTSNRSEQTQLRPWLVSAVYLLHPFTLVNCLARTTLSFSTLLTMSATLLGLQGQGLAAVSSLSVATHLSIYPALLLPPILMLLRRGPPSSSVITTIMPTVVFVSHIAALSLQAKTFVGSWSFGRTAMSLLSVSDLTPNVGLSWYLFIEMFDHFRTFFVGAFHLHVISYVAPLCIKLRHDPLFALVILTGVFATFKSYPSVGDAAVFHALLCLYPEITSHMRHPLLSASLIFYSICLLPAFHHLWLYAGSGNANFYYASTLVWSIGTGALVLDALFAFLRRDFALAKGVEGDASVVVVQE